MKSPLFPLILAFTLFLSLPGKGESFHWNQGRGYQPFRYATPTGIEIDNLTDSLLFDYYKIGNPTEEIVLSFRSRNLNGNPGKKYPYFNKENEKRLVENPVWGFFITTPEDSLFFRISAREANMGQESKRTAFVDLYSSNAEYRKSFQINDGINTVAGENIWSAVLGRENITLYGGNKGLNKIFETNRDPSVITGFGFFAGWGSHLLIRDINLELPEKIIETHPDFNPEDLTEYFRKSRNHLEGYWQIYDWELEESLVKSGGNYKLACLKDGEGYSFIYLEGSRVNKDEWAPGDIKIKLYPASFDGIFNAVWIDSMKRPLDYEIKAEESDGDILTFQFPYQSSKLRLRKLKALNP